MFLDDKSEFTEAMVNEYDANCVTIDSAIEDMHHRNLARLSLLKENHDIAIASSTLLELKVEVLLDLLVGEDRLSRLQAGFAFQRKLSEHLDLVEHEVEYHNHKE